MIKKCELVDDMVIAPAGTRWCVNNCHLIELKGNDNLCMVILDGSAHVNGNGY